MSKKITVRCDECGKIFKITQHSIKTRDVYVSVREKLTVQYFKCDKCNKPYVISIDNADTREIKRLYQRCIDGIRLLHANNNKVIMSVEKKEQQLEMLIGRSEDLKQQYYTDVQNVLSVKYKDRILPML